MGLTPTATEAQIRRRYLELAKVVHPDAGGDRYQFQILTEAFEVLSDPAARAVYDAETLPQPRPARPDRSGEGSAVAWLIDGCATEVVGWTFVALFFVALAVLAAITGQAVDEVQTAGVVGFGVFVVGALSLRYVRSRAR